MMVTEERIYSVIYGYVNNSGEFDNLDNWLERNERLPELNDLFKMVNLLVDIRQDMSYAEAKKRCTGGLYKSMMNLIKNAKKVTANASIHGAWEFNGKLYVTDSFSAIRTAEHFEFPEAVGIPSLVSVFKTAEKHKSNGYMLELPKLSDLKAHIKIKKAEFKATNQKNATVEWEFPEHGILVDAKYLLNILSGMPDCKAYANGTCGAIYFENEHAEAVLLPRKKW